MGQLMLHQVLTYFFAATSALVSVEQELLATHYVGQMIDMMNLRRLYNESFHQDPLMHPRVEPNLIRTAFHSCQGKCDAAFDPEDPFNKGIEVTSNQLDEGYKKYVELWNHIKDFKENDVYLAADKAFV